MCFWGFSTVVKVSALNNMLYYDNYGAKISYLSKIVKYEKSIEIAWYQYDQIFLAITSLEQCNTSRIMKSFKNCVCHIFDQEWQKAMINGTFHDLVVLLISNLNDFWIFIDGNTSFEFETCDHYQTMIGNWSLFSRLFN